MTIRLDIIKTDANDLGLEYNTRNYVAHPSTKEVKVKLAKIATHDVLVYITPLLKATFHAAWRILMTFVIQGLPSTSPKDGIHQCKYLLEGKPIDPQDTEGNLHPIVKGFPATNPDEALLEDSEDHLKDLSDEDMYEAREEIDDKQPHTKEEHQPTEHHSPEPSKEKSPFLHISPEPSPEASKKPKKSKKIRVRRSQLEPSPEASKKPEPSNSESSAFSLDFKAFDNNVPTTERFLTRNL
ncbi:hypothetical protein Tco_0775465 [Tanacetum coccineum]